MKPEHILENLLRSIVAGIAQNTPNPEIEWFPSKGEFSLRVNGVDQGRFVGKSGRVIWAIETIFWYAGLAQIAGTAGLNLLEPLVVEKNLRPLPFRPVAEWDRAKIESLMKAIIESCFKRQAVYDVRDDGIGKAIVLISLDEYFKTATSNPSLPDAISTVVHSAGMSNGVNIQVEFLWV